MNAAIDAGSSAWNTEANMDNANACTTRRSAVACSGVRVVWLDVLFLAVHVLAALSGRRSDLQRGCERTSATASQRQHKQNSNTEIQKRDTAYNIRQLVVTAIFLLCSFLPTSLPARSFSTMRVSSTFLFLCLCVFVTYSHAQQTIAIFEPCVGQDVNCAGGTSLVVGGESICCPGGSGLNINENGAYCSGGGGRVGCMTNSTWSAYSSCNATLCGVAGMQTRTCIGPFFGGANNCLGSPTKPCVASTATNCTTANATSTDTSASSSTGPASGSSIVSDPFQTGGGLPFSCSCVCCLGAGCQSTLVGSTGTGNCDAATACTSACATAFPTQCPAVNQTQGASITVCRINGAGAGVQSGRMWMALCMGLALFFMQANKGW